MRDSGAGQARGFTLIETLVALVLATIAAAVVLEQVHSLMQRAEREQSHQLAAMQLLNDSLRMSNGGISDFPIPRLEKDHLVIEPYDSNDLGLPVIEVRNYSVRNEALPPIEFAYTPFQSFEVSRDRYTLHALRPGIKAPESAATETLPEQVEAVKPWEAATTPKSESSSVPAPASESK